MNTPTSNAGTLRPNPRPAGAGTLHRIHAWIRDNHQHPDITTADIAEGTQAAPEALHRICRATWGLKPTQLLHRIRPYQSRQAMVATQPGRDTVGGIASGVGYLSRSAFGAHYGETPAVTLRRTPPSTPSAPPPDPPDGRDLTDGEWALITADRTTRHTTAGTPVRTSPSAASRYRNRQRLSPRSLDHETNSP